MSGIQPQLGAGGDVGSLFALRSLDDLERDLLTLLQGLEAIHLDGGKVREQILTSVIGRNESISLGVVEPLDSTCCHFLSFLQHASPRCRGFSSRTPPPPGAAVSLAASGGP